jgi:BirA family biotin operon repressor/biotin-[acetyl-CoA-carboxylase] ligase
MSMRSEVLKILADGHFHSGTELGRSLHVTRAAVCKTVKLLSRSGLQIHRVRGRGYRLEAAFLPLQEELILRHLDAADRPAAELIILEEVDSTNQHLLRGITAENSAPAICLTEAQSAGRGRRGRKWVATPYRNVMLSLSWRFEAGPTVASGLSLAAGVAVVRALNEYGVSGLGLKWPNDIVWQQRKLAGLLIDVRGEASGPSLVVLGLGVNGYISAGDAAEIDQPWVDLLRICGEAGDRNRLAGLLLKHLLRMFQVFERQGLEPFRQEWERLHAFSDKRVRLRSESGEIAGIVRGIDKHGALLVEDPRGNLRAFHSGEISVRLAT